MCKFMQAKENYAVDVTRTFIANDFKILLFFFLSLFLTFLYFFGFVMGHMRFAVPPVSTVGYTTGYTPGHF